MSFWTTDALIWWSMLTQMYTLLGYKFSIPLYAIIRQIQAYRFFKIYWSKNVALLHVAVR